jgi:TolB-like protein/Tfp pilus assembly protein PilF
MPSLLPGYAYDIFISYRHNDNRSGWVTEFVKALQEELATTIKDPISVYFDTNPHDGLLETHNVDKSLEGKLKCLIFIPIISQTYCDPKSFAWQYEFCAFNKLTKDDLLGREVKLNSGNVASRILPIRIHDLDSDDTAMIENEQGSVLRAIDFVYKEAGVNRPLKPTDHKNDNLNKTDYRNQVNKVANAVKEILLSLQNPRSFAANTTSKQQPSHAQATHDSPLTSDQKHSNRKKVSVAVLLLTLAIIASYLIYRSTGNEQRSTHDDASIAVLPFDDLTPNGDMEYLGDGIADEIINSLTSIKDLKVTGRTSSFQFKGEKIDIRTVGDRLHVGYVLEGSIQKYEDNFRITAQLIRTADNFHAWSQRFDLREVNIFKIQDLIATAVVEKLRLTLSSSEKNKIITKETSPEAYNEYLKGLHLFRGPNTRRAIPFFKMAIQLDSTYAPAFALLGMSMARNLYQSNTQPHPDSIRVAMHYATRATQLAPNLPEGYSAMALISWMNQRDFAKARVYFEKSIELNPSSSLTRNRYGYFLTWMGDFAKASQMCRVAQSLDPVDWNSYVLLFDSAYYNNDPQAASRILSKYRDIFGTDSRWLDRRILLDYMNKDYRGVIRRYDSIQARGENLGGHDLGLMARSYIASGDRKRADSILSKMVRENIPGSHFPVALVFASQNKPDSCFKYLTIAARKYDLMVITLKIHPELKHLHNDTRYAQLYKEMGFDKY